MHRRSWREKIQQPSKAVQQYLARVTAITADSPHLLLAHAYTQHMAILAGGQTIRRSVRASMQLGPEDPGTAAFELQVLSTILPYKTVRVCEQSHFPAKL